MISLDDSLPGPLLEYVFGSPIPLAIGSATLPDEPLVAVNGGFCALTGYREEAVLGRNCRFLQPEGEEEARRLMRQFIEDPEAEAGRFDVVNLRADGTRFDNRVFLSRLRDSKGVTQFFFASQFDMTRREQAINTAAGYNAQLASNIDDFSEISRSYGLMMEDSTRLLSGAAASIAQMRFGSPG